jgi:hypothetical protein
LIDKLSYFVNLAETSSHACSHRRTDPEADGWTDFNGLNVTPMSVDVESLGDNEVEPKNSSGDSP